MAGFFRLTANAGFMAGAVRVQACSHDTQSATTCCARSERAAAPHEAPIVTKPS